MKTTWAVGAVVVGMTIGTGCARTSVSAVRWPLDIPTAAGEPSAIRVGQLRIVDGHLNLRALRRAEAPREAVERVSLNDGSYLLCWTTGTAEQGRSALAQSFNADGSSHGGPVVISRPEVDVIDTPRVNTKNDAGHIVATFAAAYESSIALVEVPLDVLAEGSQSGDVIAAK